MSTAPPPFPGGGGDEVNQLWNRMLDILHADGLSLDSIGRVKRGAIGKALAQIVSEERTALAEFCYEIRKPPAVNSWEAGWNRACDTIERRIRSIAATGKAQK